MYNLVDLPFSPSGVTSLLRLHRAYGLEKELAQISELFDVVERSRSNVLAVVVAPYGYGKSEFLDEVYGEAQRRGLRTVRLALTNSFKEEAVRSVADKKEGEPLIVLIDEADELSRLAAMYKLGALTNEQFRQAVMDLAAIVRALLEPKNYPHMLRNPQNYDKVLIIAALTPQVYYTVLKNVVPDVFDITTGRVYREIQLDARFPFWQFVEVVKARLYAYSPQERRAQIDSGALSPIAPFSLAELAGLYNIALKKGEASPRYLLKLAARLLQLKESGKGVAELAEEEGIDVHYREAALYALAAIPVKEIDKKYINIFKKVKLYKFPFNDKEAINVINKILILRGKEISPRDPKSASYEPNLYYALIENDALYIYLSSSEELKELAEYYEGPAYIIGEDVAGKITGEDEATRLGKELAERLQDPISLLDEIEKAAGLAGIKLRVCCGRALWYNSLGFRELFILYYINNEEELKQISNNINKIIIEGTIENYVVDYLIAIIISPTMLSSEIQQALSPLAKISWKNALDPAERFFRFIVFGADKLDKLKNKLIKYNINRILNRETEKFELIDEIKLYREESRENVLKYTLALKKGKERKEMALLKAAEQIARGETPDGMASYGKIEDALLRRIGDAEVHERELKWIVESMFPVNLWRDIKAEDLIALMTYTGALIPKGKIYVKFNEPDGKKYLDELEKELIRYSNIEISINSKIFGEIKISRAIDVATMPTQFRDRAEYASRVIELHKALMDARARADAAKRELEEELRAKRALVAELEKIAGQLPQRARFLRLDESVAAREAEVAKLVSEIKEVWGSLRPLAKELGKRLAVEEDLEALLNLPEPWLGDYLATLKVYSAELRKEYEEHRRRLKLRENVMAWAKSRLGIADGVEEALEKLAGDLGVPRGLLYAVASRGPGAVLEPEQLAAELSADPAVVVRGLEALASRGLITKKYVA